MRWTTLMLLLTMFIGCMDSKQSASQQSPSQQDQEVSQQPVLEVSGGTNNSAAQEEPNSGDEQVVYVSYPDPTEGAMPSTIEQDSKGNTIVEIARNFSGALSDTTVQEYQGRAIAATETFPTVQLTIPSGTSIPFSVARELVPPGFVIRWLHAMMPTDPSDPLCQNNDGDAPMATCGLRWIEETIDQSNPAVVSISIDRLEREPGGRIDIHVQVHRYAFTDADRQRYFCCGTMSAGVHTSLNSEGHYRPSAEAWPRSIVCGFETLGSPTEECSAD